MYQAQRLPSRRRTSPQLTQYAGFKGVDFSGDDTKISKQRFAYAQNIVVEGNGYPRKRLGWETQTLLDGTNKPSGKVHGLYFFNDGTADNWIVHIGTKLYTTGKGFAGTFTEVTGGTMADSRSVGFVFDKTLYLLDGTHYYAIKHPDTESFIVSVSDVAYVPTTSIGRLPTGGGTSNEAVNLLTAKRKNTFSTDGIATTFLLDSAATGNIICKHFNGSAWETVTGAISGSTVTISPALADSDGNPYLEIEFTSSTTPETVIPACTMYTHMQYGNGVYVFLSGNSSNPNKDWHSGINDPSYFPDTGYAYYGTSGTIMGYGQFGTQLAVFKKTSQEPTVYLRSVTSDSSGNVSFPITVGAMSSAAIAKESFANLVDDLLFLTADGVCTLTSMNVASQASVANRSYFIDGKLLTETALENAVACVWRGRYLLSMNDSSGSVYVLDGNLSKSYNNANSGDFSYEGTYWTNVHASCFLEVDGVLYFGTSSLTLNAIRKFREDTTMARYNDDDDAIDAIISTKLDDDGNFMLTKTMRKKGSGLMLQPYTRSSVDVYLTTMDYTDKLIKSATMDIFDFGDIDFDRFTFNTQRSAQVIPFLKKEKKYTALQITLRNNVASEGFGVLGIIKSYDVVNYVK